MENQRREFLKNITLGGFGAAVAPDELFSERKSAQKLPVSHRSNREFERKFNEAYEGAFLNRVAFPIGGIGTGMFCIEGTGAISHMSIRHRPEIFHEPGMFAAITIKGEQTKAKVLEGPVPEWKLFGQRGTGNGAAGTTFGLPRFKNASFKTRFPFADITLDDPKFPLKVNITAWNPFIPNDPDNSSLPVGGIEYTFTNTSASSVDAIFSFITKLCVSQSAFQ